MPKLTAVRGVVRSNRSSSLATPATLAGRDLLTVGDLSVAEAHGLLNLAQEVKRKPARFSRALAGRGLALLFEKPSLRTRVTFQLAIEQLGGRGLDLGPQEIGLGTREAVGDVARNLERWFNAIVIRSFAHDTVCALADNAAIPVINGLSDRYHPCQALGDYLTLHEHKTGLEGLRVAFVGDGNNVCHSLALAAAKLGVTLGIATPPGYEPAADVLHQARAEAAATGAPILLVHDPREAVRGADAVYTDVWTSMGQEAEREQRRQLFLPYQVNAKLFAEAKPDAVFLHCLPARRGEEVTDEVMDSPRSIIYDQAENRLHIQKAILLALLGEAR
ncbi:MAG: ornithine carbamoyltransferase [Terriglobia bacterium]